MRNPRVALGAALLAGLVVMAALLPPTVKLSLHTEGPLHPWFHLLAFLALSALVSRSAPSPLARVLLVLLLAILGWGTEYLESARDGWPIERHDVLLDLTGVLLGGLLGGIARGGRRTDPVA